MANASSPSSDEPIVWLNREFRPLHQAAVSPMDRGFLYGDGLFETLRAEKGAVLYLGEHLHRLSASLGALRIELNCEALGGDWEGSAFDLAQWDSILRQLLARNNLEGECAAVKILVTRGVVSGLGLPQPSQPTVCLSARAYHPPDAAVYREGWRLHVAADGFSPPLARHKTLNYLHFLCARQAALDSGADEAVVLDPWGNVAETAAGSILARLADGWVQPETPYQLAGTTVQLAASLLRESGEPVSCGPLGLDALRSADTIWVVNSLMGVMPAAQLDGCPVPNPRSEDAARCRRLLFERGASGG